MSLAKGHTRRHHRGSGGHGGSSGESSGSGSPIRVNNSGVNHSKQWQWQWICGGQTVVGRTLLSQVPGVEWQWVDGRTAVVRVWNFDPHI